MKIFSINDNADQILCDTSLCLAEIRHRQRGQILIGPAQPQAETVLCLVQGQAEIDVEIDGQTQSIRLSAMQGVQLPSGSAWRVHIVSNQCKLLRVDSFHPGHTAAENLMPPLQQAHVFDLVSGASLVYTDYMRGGVLTFAPGFAADRHYHERADELFWFFEGSCQVTTHDQDETFLAGTLVYTAPSEWHIIANPAEQPLLMFLVVTPNVVPSHTFFDADGQPVVRSRQPLTRMG